MADNSHLDQFAQKYGLAGKTAAPKANPTVQKPVDPTEAFGKYLVDKTTAAAFSLQDGNEYGKASTFDSSPTGAFKDRYKAYGQKTYNKVGFDPLINNEVNFNANTSTFDDAKRWLTSSALPMMGLGFLDPLNSYKDAIQGNATKGATDSAKDYEYYNMLGYSSRGGLGGFGVNLLNSFSYSAGVMLEGALEGAAIGAAVGAVAGEGIGAVPGAAIGGLVEGVSALTKIPRALYQTAKTIGNISKAVKGLTAVNNAKNVWTAAKTGATTVGKILNPLENTTEAILNLSKWKDIDNITGLARASKTAGAFWHDMMSMNMALSEGKLEGGFSEINQYEKLYNDYYAKYGKAPDEETQRKMVLNAREAGSMNTLANTALVFVSNKIALPSLTKAKFLKGLPSLNAGKVVGTVGKEFQLVVNNADDIAKASMEKVPITFKNSLKALTSPRKMGATAVNYFKSNLIEGLQEVGQDALSSAVEDYYTKSFYDPSVRSYRMGMSALADGISKQSIFSETFLSGFAMGTLLQGPSKLVKHGSRLGNRIFKSKDTYDQYIKDRTAEADRIVESFNNMVGENSKHLFNPAVNSLSAMNVLARNVDNPDDTTTKKLKDDSAGAFALSMLSSIRNGTFDMYIDHIKNYKNATPEEIEEAWNLEKGQGQEALNNLDQAIGNAQTIKNRFEYAQKRYRPAVLKEKFQKGTEEYKKADLYEKAYMESLSSFVFLQSSFDDTLGRLDKLYGSLSKLDAVASSPFANFSVLTNDATKLDREIEMLKSDIEIGIQSNEPISQEDVAQKRKLLNSLYKFQEAQNEMTQILFLAKDAKMNTEELIEKMKEDGIDLHSNYSEAFLDVLNTIAGTPEKQMQLQDQIQKAGGFEEIYQALFDTHLLAKDRNILSDYINLLADPKEFYEHVDRNFQWMKNMYDNKKEYIKEIVNQEFKIAEHNEILTTLADKGIFVDLDKFADWVDDERNIPNEFIDTTNNMIITESSVLYDEYARIFSDAAKLSKIKPAGEPLTDKQKFDDKLAEINAEKTNALNTARETYEQQFLDEYGRELDAIEQQNARIKADNEELEIQKKEAQDKINIITDALDVLTKTNAAKISQTVKKLLEEGILTQEELDTITALDSSNPETLALVQGTYQKIYDAELSEEELLFAALSAITLPDFIVTKIDAEKEILDKQPGEPIDIESTTAYKVYTEKVKQINDDFENREKNVKEEFASKGIDENTFDDITPNTPYDNMPDDLKARIDEAFDKFLVEMGDPTLKAVDIIKYQDTRENWIEQNGREIIADYNAEKLAESKARAEQLKKPPFLKYNKKQVLSTESVAQLNQLYKQLKALSDSGKNAKGVDLTDQQKADLKEDLENLAGYLDALAKVYKPKSVAQKVVNQIVERVINRRGEVEDVVDAEGRKTRKFAGEESTEEQSPLKRVTEIATKIAEEKANFKYEGYNKKPNILKRFSDILENEKDLNKAVDTFMSLFKQLVSKGYGQFDSKAKLDAIEKGLRADPTLERLEKLIDQYAFIESTDAGTKVDELIRKFLTLDAGSGEGFAEVKYTGSINVNGVDYKVSDFMSEKAFNTLFGPGGIVSSIRSKMIDGEFVLFPENLLVFDKTLGITGEIDLLAVNTKGEVMIIDIKTSKNWDSYKKPNNYKNISHRAQLSIYSTLFYNMTGIKPTELKILPLQIDVNVDGYVKDIGKAMVDVLDKDGKPIKMPDGKANKKELLTKGYYELPFLEDIADYGVTMIEPQFEDEETDEDVDLDGTGETQESLDKIEETEDFEKITLTNLLNKTVLYKGSLGKLVTLSDGSFAIEKTVNKDLNALEVLLNSLKADLEYEEKIDPNSQIAEQIKNSITDTKADIEEQKTRGGKEITILYNKFKPATNGSLNALDLGISLVTGITFPFQVNKVNGVVIKATFNNQDESVATINGVRYNVIRDKSDAIVALSYRKNEKEIFEIDQVIDELNKELSRINKIVKTQNIKQKSNVTKLFVLNKISELKDAIDSLNAKKSKLLETNDVVLEKGGNTNDYIFALNSLPNSFQKATKSFKPENEKKHLKELDRLSLSSAISKKITEILNENYPEQLDTLIDDGVKAITPTQLMGIYYWIDETIDALNVLGETIINRGDLVDDISNQINALLQLQNDLNLIKIINDGKTKKPRLSKQQAAANKVFGATAKKVQERTSVSENERVASGQAKTVSGLPAERVTTDELKEIVSSAKSIKPALTVSKKATAKESTLFDGINNAKSKEELESAYETAINNRGDVKITAIQEAYQKRLKELQNVSSNTLKKGSLLISKTSIFDGAENVVVEVVMMNPSSKQIVVKIYGTDTKRTFTEQELKDNFIKYSKEAMEAEKEKETPITEETQDNSMITKDNLEEFSSDTEIVKKAEKEAESTDKATRFNNLFNNSKTC